MEKFNGRKILLHNMYYQKHENKYSWRQWTETNSKKVVAHISVVRTMAFKWRRLKRWGKTLMIKSHKKIRQEGNKTQKHWLPQRASYDCKTENIATVRPFFRLRDGQERIIRADAVTTPHFENHSMSFGCWKFSICDSEAMSFRPSASRDVRRNFRRSSARPWTDRCCGVSSDCFFQEWEAVIAANPTHRGPPHSPTATSVEENNDQTPDFSRNYQYLGKDKRYLMLSFVLLQWHHFLACLGWVADIFVRRSRAGSLRIAPQPTPWKHFYPASWYATCPSWPSLWPVWTRWAQEWGSRLFGKAWGGTRLCKVTHMQNFTGLKENQGRLFRITETVDRQIYELKLHVTVKAHCWRGTTPPVWTSAYFYML